MSDQFDFGPADQEAIERREAARRSEEYMHAKMNEIRNAPMNDLNTRVEDYTEELLRDAPRHPTIEAMRAIEETLNPIDDTLAERRTVHGDFTDDATTAQALKYIMRQGKNWDEMPSFMREALEQMQTKIARILAGDFRHPDHWKDLQGYPRLVEYRL